MIAKKDLQPDTVTDLIGAKVRRMQRISQWNGTKRRLRDELDRMLHLYGYRALAADPRDYQLKYVGDAYQYDVPLDKRGHLQEFRGKRVRLVCVHSGCYRVGIRVGVVGSITSSAEV